MSTIGDLAGDPNEDEAYDPVEAFIDSLVSPPLFLSNESDLRGDLAAWLTGGDVRRVELLIEGSGRAIHVAEVLDEKSREEIVEYLVGDLEFVSESVEEMLPPDSAGLPPGYRLTFVLRRRGAPLRRVVLRALAVEKPSGLGRHLFTYEPSDDQAEPAVVAVNPMRKKLPPALGVVRG
jgi:hypothetical protein